MKKGSFHRIKSITPSGRKGFLEQPLFSRRNHSTFDSGLLEEEGLCSAELQPKRGKRFPVTHFFVEMIKAA